MKFIVFLIPYLLALPILDALKSFKAVFGKTAKDSGVVAKSSADVSKVSAPNEALDNARAKFYANWAEDTMKSVKEKQAAKKRFQEQLQRSFFTGQAPPVAPRARNPKFSPVRNGGFGQVAR